MKWPYLWSSVRAALASTGLILREAIQAISLSASSIVCMSNLAMSSSTSLDGRSLFVCCQDNAAVLSSILSDSNSAVGSKALDSSKSLAAIEFPNIFVRNRTCLSRVNLQSRLQCAHDFRLLSAALHTHWTSVMGIRL